MDSTNVKVGTRVEHPRYGEGIVSRISLAAYEIFFEQGGKIEILKSNSDLTILEIPADGQIDPVSANDLKKAISMVLDDYGLLPPMVELGAKWEGGSVILKPGSDSLQPKEIPMDTFFKKIIMVRDRLRVLEQNVNSHKSLSEEEKVHLQQYITKAYGSLTTFNVLFAEKEDYFVGSGKKD